MTILFKASVGGDQLEISLASGAMGADFDHVVIKAGGEQLPYPLVEALDRDVAAGQFEAFIDVAKLPNDALDQAGLIGFRPTGAAAAMLRAARIVVRPCEPDSRHTSDAPFFALYLDWAITANVAGSSQFSDQAGSVAVGASAELTVTTGFSCIHPPSRMPRLAARALQLRVDLDCLAATTGWFSLLLVDLSSPFSLDGLRAWFMALVGAVDVPRLPDWNLDLRLKFGLPFGLRFQESYLILSPGPGGTDIEARASGLILDWPGGSFDHDDAEFSLVSSDAGYVFTAVVLAAQAPAKNTPWQSGALPKQTIALPFGALSLTAAAWRISVGLFASGSPVKLCPELIIEIADVTLGSSLGQQPLWQSDAVRLHLRGQRLLSCTVTDPLLLFAQMPDTNWLARYRDARMPSVTAYSGIADKTGAASGEGPQAFTFLDGDFDAESHMSLLWEQDNAHIFKALASVIPGLSEDRHAGANEPHVVAFELARFETPAGPDLQARLEWRPKAGAAPPPMVAPGKPQGVPDDYCATETDGVFSLIMPQGGTNPAAIVDPALRLDLPLVELAIAAPDARAMLYYRPSGEAATLSLIHLYASQRPVLQARLDLAIASGSARQLLPTQNAPPTSMVDSAATAPVADPPFIDLRLGSGDAAQALAVLSWQEGQRPRTMRAYQGRGDPFRSLLPAKADTPVPGTDCTHCPSNAPIRPTPLNLNPARFRAPNPFGADNGWTLALHISAKRALRSFLSSAVDSKGLIDFTIEKICLAPPAADDAGEASLLPALHLHTALSVNLSLLGGGGEVSGKAVFEFDPEDMSLRMIEGGVFSFKSKVWPMPGWLRKRGTLDEKDYHFSDELDLLDLGFDALFYKSGPAPVGDEAEFLTLDLRSGRFVIGLAEGVSCYLRYAGLGEGGLVFQVSTFQLGSGGLDVEATIDGGTLKLPGLLAPFTLKGAGLSIIGNRVRRMSIDATGTLPEIMGSAALSVTLTLGQQRAGGRVELEELACTLDKGNQPIRAESVQFEFTITELSLTYLAKGRDRQFYFMVTGAAQFMPDGTAFDGGLLENLKSARCEFTRAPVSDEFIDHLTVIAELNEPVTFNVFNVFRMEIRAIGFAPKHAFEGGTPRAAIIIGGQCEFADTGDVISAEIDFHRMYIGLPKTGGVLPQVEFKDLRVEIRAADGFSIGGAVRVLDEDNRKGFKGDGFVQLPGFPQIGAAFAFMELRHDAADSWKRAWFIALEASGISYQLGPLPIYLRQAALGFGYRMTSLLLRTQPQDQTLAQLVDYLLRALDQHQTLAHIDSWTEDLENKGERGRWSVAAEAVFTLGSSQADPLRYNAKNERELRTILLQLMLAINPNGLVAGAKLWFPVSYDDLLRDRGGMRRRPLAKGFVHFAPRAQRLLAYATKSSNPYYGPPGNPLTDLAKTVLDPVPFECAALIEPGRVRGEIGWPDRLVFSFDLGPLKIKCRGGILYAVENNTAIYGLYFAARGRLALGGGAGGGSLGLRVSAETNVSFATRLMIAQPLLKPLGGHVYAQVGIDLSVRFRVEAWFKFKAGFIKISLSISFSISLQIVIALEIGFADGRKLGFKGRATIVISVFGRALRASITAGVHEDGVNDARRVVARYMSSMLEPGKIPPVPGIAPLRPTSADLTALAAPIALPGQDAASAAAHAEMKADSPADLAAAEPEPFAFVTIPLPDNEVDGERHWLIWIMPTADPQGKGFYPLPGEKGVWAGIEGLPADTKIFALDAAGAWAPAGADGVLALLIDPDKSFPVEGTGVERLTLKQAIAGCYRQLNPSDSGAFPFDFDGTQADLAPVALDQRADHILQDERVLEGPRDTDPVLDPNHHYDEALGRVIAEGDAPLDLQGGAETADKQARDIEEREEAARANQGFLLTAFRDDIAEYVKKAGVGVPPPPPSADRARVWDSGMVVLLRAKDLPDWAHSRSSTEAPGFAIGSIKQTALRPLVDPGSVSFAGDNLRHTRPVVAHFDEQRLALSWSIDWKQGKTICTAPGIGKHVEDYLDHYRVELFIPGDSEKAITSREVLPANLLARGAGGPGKSGHVELKPPYDFTIRTDELFATVVAGGQVLRKVIAVVTPVNQYGSSGQSFTVTATQDPSYTPLPAEEPRLDLGWEGKTLTRAELSWREPALPNQDGIASTTHWELIIRKVPHIPLGPYPQASGAAGGADSLGGAEQVLQPGDLVARIAKTAKDNAGGNVLDRLESGTFGSPAYRLPIETARLLAPSVEWLDYRGNPIPSGSAAGASALVRMRSAFLAKTSVLHESGHAWQLFLRAAAISSDSFKSSSSIAPVRAYAIVPPTKGSSTIAAEPARHVPLATLEWPEPVADIWLDPPEIMHGPRHVPTIAAGWNGSDDPRIAYLPAGDETRVVTAKWSGFPPNSPPHPSRPSIAAYAGFRLFEAREEGLTNADLAARAALTPDQYGREIARFEAADPALAAALPASLIQTELWQCWSPADARLLAWRESTEPALWPPTSGAHGAWYSWADADLVWPPKAAPATASENPAFERSNLHPMLVCLVKELEKWAVGAGLRIDIAAGKPEVDAVSRIDWMAHSGAGKDPYGWAALWHLGLALEIAAADAITGEPVPQDDIREAATCAITKLVSAEYAQFAPHIALDLPLRANAGLAAGSCAAVALPDIALGRLQIALRPRVAPTEVYCWIKTPAGKDRDAVVVRPAPWTPPTEGAQRPPGVHWMDLSGGEGAPGFLLWPDAQPDRMNALGKLLTKNRSLLFKIPRSYVDSFKSSIEASIGSIEAFAWATSPLCLDGAADQPWMPTPVVTTDDPTKCIAMPLWPHGRFPADTGNLPSTADAWGRFIELLGAAPLATGDAALDVDGNSPPPVGMDDAEKEAVVAQYSLWSQRFFASAPLVDILPGSGIIAFHNTAVAALRSEAVELIAPGPDGAYRHNRIVSWQWATARSLAVAGVGRYDALLETLAPETVRALPAPGTRAVSQPFALDRIRKLEPPQLMGERIVRSNDGTDYHEIAIAPHTEERLAGHNSLVDFKLQFRGLGFRFHRRFRFAGIAGKIAAEAGKCREPRGVFPEPAWRPVPHFAAGDDDFLRRYPAARFGATSLHLPAEPYFYRSTLDLRAASHALSSPMLSYALALPAPAQCRPEGAGTVAVSNVTRAFDGPLAAAYQRWREALSASGTTDVTLGIAGLAIDLRFPRLFESLEGDARQTEGRARALGALPDCDARVQIAWLSDGGLAPLLLVQAHDDAKQPELFTLRGLADGLRYELAPADYSTWDTGVHLKTTLSLALDPVEASTPLGTLALPAEPASRAEADLLFAPDHLPAWGPLATLAPLALRLSAAPAKSGAGLDVTFQHPFAASAAGVRPLSLQADAAGGRARPGVADYAAALRLLLDAERLAAAKAGVYNGNAPPAELLAALEDGHGIACRVPGEGAITAAMWDGWQAAGLKFWALGSLDGSWEEANDLPATAPVRLIAHAPEWTAAREVAFGDFLALPPLAGSSALSIAAIRAAEALSAVLARGWFDKAALARTKLPPTDAIVALVQRGNDPQTFWGGRPV